MLVSLGSIVYFSCVYTIWAISEISKHRKSKTVQDMSSVAEKKKLELIKSYEYEGVLAYFNPSFFPRDISFDPMMQGKENTSIVNYTEDT